MNILSCFDGMSCGRIALEKLGIQVDNYYASEIDKHAIQVTKKNYPDTIHVGDVTKVKGSDIPVEIDLLIGGSPCQGFSFAGKNLNFDDPRSKLFFEFVRLLKELKPKYFLLENVRMKQESQDVISEHLGVKPVMINSALVSAQNRVRLYWTNIPVESLPEDKGIVLKDILEDGLVDREKSHCLDANYFKGGNLKSYFEKNRRQLVFSGHYKNNFRKLTPMECAGTHGYALGHIHRPCEPKVLCGRIVGRKINPKTGKRDDYNPDLKTEQRLEPRLDEKSGTLTTVQKDNVVVTHPTYRKLTPMECERLQTVPDNYTNHVSNTQRYKMLGNGWTVDVISHIFGGLLSTEAIKQLEDNKSLGVNI
jgi:site-specific DNA-cytosine methylase